MPFDIFSAKLRWHIVGGSHGDGRNCDGCLARSTWPSRTLAQWQDEGVPGAGTTECEDNCRCVLLPESYGQVKQEMWGEQVKPGIVDYTIFDRLNAAIEKFKLDFNGAKLPASFYELTEVTERLALMTGILDGTIPFVPGEEN